MRFLACLLVLLPSIAWAQWDMNTNGGAIVHLFEWRWEDVAHECETVLSENGYGGVQISPPNEVVAVYQSVDRPWWERYQPVSYKIESRSGDYSALQDMIDRCNAAGVRIFVDAVINHMSGGWPSGTGTTGSSSFDSGSESYPGVPYSYLDFNDGNCQTSSGDIECYSCDADQVRNCKLVGLNDLNLGKDYVRGKIIDFMNGLIDMGVAGFRVDACKHMWPGDLSAIFGSLNDLRSDIFGSGARPFIVQEVIDNGGEAVTAADYLSIGRVTEFKFSSNIGQVFRGENGQKLAYLSNFGEGWGFMASGSALTFVDNHDNQRGHGAGGSSILNYKTSKLYKMATGFNLAWDYGVDRVMSSFEFENTDAGPPQDGNNNIVGPTYEADGSCSGGWVCEHRWRQIYSMAKFGYLAQGSAVANWWDNGSQMIAFSRGSAGFVAFNNEGYDMKETLQTGMSSGTYCDIVSGSKSGSSCSGKTVTVNGDGTAYIEILNSEYDGFLAIHSESKL